MAVTTAAPGVGVWGAIWQGITRSTSGFVGLCLVLSVLLFSFVGPLLIETDNPTDVTKIWGPMTSEHWLGTNHEGKDTFIQLVLGGREPIWVGFTAALITVAIAVVLGSLAGYLRGRVDHFLLQLTDITMTIPFIVLMLVIASFYRAASPMMVSLIIGLVTWPYLMRSIRAQVLTLKEREFVEASRSLGAGSAHIVFREILPNLVTPILVYSTLLIPTNILFEAALSFLGVGINPPTPSWGKMLSEAVPFYQTAPYFIVFPGLAIFVTVLAFNLFGDGLRDAFDPKTSD